MSEGVALDQVIGVVALVSVKRGVVLDQVS